jgi:hypothetical protein
LIELLFWIALTTSAVLYISIIATRFVPTLFRYWFRVRNDLGIKFVRPMPAFFLLLGEEVVRTSKLYKDQE